MSRKVSKPRITAPIEDVDLPPDRHPARGAVIGVATGVLFVALLRAGWGAIGERRWHAAQAGMRNCPFAAPDTPPIPVPTSSSPDPIAYLLRGAQAAALSEAELEKVNDVDPLRGSASPPDLAELRRIVGARREVFADLRRARAAGNARWPADSSASADLKRLTDVSHLQDLQYLLQYAVTVDHSAGDDAAAVEHLRDMLFVSRVAGRCSGSPAFLLACGMAERAVESLDDVCFTLQVNAMQRSAERSQVRSLVDELVDDDNFERRVADAVRSDALDTIHWIRDSQDGRQRKIVGQSTVSGQWQVVLVPHWANLVAGKIAGPFYAFKGAYQLDFQMELLRAVSAPDYPSLCLQLPAPPRPIQRDFVFGADWVMRDFSRQSGDLWVGICFETCAARRLAAAQLALRWYSCDHSGQLPASLDALVPQYLPSVPQDICAASGTRIGYVPAATQPFVYSVGRNGVDDLAAGGWTAPSNASVDDRFRMPDLVWYVGPPRPTTPPAPIGTSPLKSSAQSGR